MAVDRSAAMLQYWVVLQAGEQMRLVHALGAPASLAHPALQVRHLLPSHVALQRAPGEAWERRHERRRKHGRRQAGGEWGHTGRHRPCPSHHCAPQAVHGVHVSPAGVPPSVQ